MNENLTPAEMQLVRSILAFGLSHMQEDINNKKKEISQTWPLCIPTDSSTKDEFTYLNLRKNQLRSVKRKYAKIAAIQRKLKKNS